MNYRLLSFAESIQALLTSCISVGCAYAGLGYWSLVLGNMCGRAANIAFVVYNRPVPFAWPHPSQVLAPLRFGMEIAVQRIVGSVNGLSDSMVIARTMGQVPVGAYRFAANLASTPVEKIGGLVMRVTGPLFSRVQSDRRMMVRYFLIFTESLAMTIFPLLFGLAIVAPEAVELLLGPKWAIAAAPLRWLAIFMTIRTMMSVMNQLLSTLRLTRFAMWMSLLTFVLMPVAFYLASPLGVGAVALAWLLTSPITVMPVAWKLFRAIGCSVTSYLNALLPALVGSGAMLVCVLALRSQLPLHGWAGLATEVAVGGLAYCACLWVFYRSRVMRFVRFFDDLRRSRNVVVTSV
jgi:O-antigen/teichoic acid export membrane protein